MSLKTRLVNHDYSDLDADLEEMLQNIGNTDADLRDGLIYPAFSDIIQNDQLNDHQFVCLFDQLLSEDCFTCKIGTTADDSVFTRSFSALVLACLLYKDKEKRILSAERFKKIYKKTLYYS